MNFSLANKRETFWVYLVSFLFIAMNIVLISNEFYYFSLIPLLLVVMLAAIFTLDKLLLVAVFVTPLSIQISDIIEGYNFDLSLPSEALLIGILLVFLMKVLYEGKFDRRVSMQASMLMRCRKRCLKTHRSSFESFLIDCSFEKRYVSYTDRSGALTNT